MFSNNICLRTLVRPFFKRFGQRTRKKICLIKITENKFFSPFFESIFEWRFKPSFLFAAEPFRLDARRTSPSICLDYTLLPSACRVLSDEGSFAFRWATCIGWRCRGDASLFRGFRSLKRKPAANSAWKGRNETRPWRTDGAFRGSPPFPTHLASEWRSLGFSKTQPSSLEWGRLFFDETSPISRDSPFERTKEWLRAWP